MDIDSLIKLYLRKNYSKRLLFVWYISYSESFETRRTFTIIIFQLGLRMYY